MHHCPYPSKSAFPETQGGDIEVLADIFSHLVRPNEKAFRYAKLSQCPPKQSFCSHRRGMFVMSRRTSNSPGAHPGHCPTAIFMSVNGQHTRRAIVKVAAEQSLTAYDLHSWAVGLVVVYEHGSDNRRRHQSAITEPTQRSCLTWPGL